MSEDNPFLKVQFSVTDEFGNLIETTDEAKAKKAGIFNENARYGYSLIMLTDSRLIKGFRQTLESAKIGEESTVTIRKADAFGERKEDLVVLIPQKKFEEAKINPQVGLTIDLDGQRGKIQSISAGRVRVDLNHELAGKDVIYNYKVLEKISSIQDKVDALLEERMGKKGLVAMDADSAIISVGQEIMKSDSYLQGKYSFIQDALQFIPELKKVVWKEEFVRTDTLKN
jgi:FKBP-type peptidyl-prolyl cis-trans isomerase 2